MVSVEDEESDWDEEWDEEEEEADFGGFGKEEW
jgi:hypothetical protein